MKFKHYLPILLLALLSTSCVKKTVTINGQNTISPEFSTDREDLKNRISEIIPAKDILISSGNTKNSGEKAFNFLTVEIVNPDSFPSGGFSFSDMANDIAEIVEEDIKNIEDYKKVKIEVRNTVEENNTEHTRTFKKEIDLEPHTGFRGQRLEDSLS